MVAIGSVKMPGWLKFGQRNGPDSLFPDETPLDALRYAVVDTELTSLDSRSNRLIRLFLLLFWLNSAILPYDQD